MNKRGQTDVKTLLALIILVVIAAIFVGIVIKGSYKGNLNEVEIEQEILDVELSNVQILNDTGVSVTLKKNKVSKDFFGVAFVMYDLNGSEIFSENLSLDELETNNFSFVFDFANASSLKKISIAPIFKKMFRKETLGEPQEKEVVSSSVSSSGGGSSSLDDSSAITEEINSEESSETSVGLELVYGDGPNNLPTQINSVPSFSDSPRSGISVPHPVFPQFSSSGYRIYSQTQDNLIANIVDTVNYKVAYYSLDGETWHSSELIGRDYEGHDGWLRGDSVFMFPENFSDSEDNYIALYSCYKEYTWDLDSPWDCHGEWQLIVVNGNETDAQDPYEKVHYFKDDLTCGNSYDYQCGSKTICGKVLDFGSCSSGYSCQDNLCISSGAESCSGVVCDSNEYCSRGVCLENVSGNTYFVATWGDDSNDGSFDSPWQTWQKGAEETYPGDITYFRGGVWSPTNYVYSSSTIGMVLGPGGYANLRSGTAQDPIKIYNYPGEKPILDGSLIGPSNTRWLSGIGIGGEHIHLKGLTIRHLHQNLPDFTYGNPNFLYGKPYSEIGAFGSNGANHYFENIVVHDVDGRGFQHWSYAWRDEDAQDSYDRCLAEDSPSTCIYETPLYENDTTSWINCDAYNLFDRYASEPGNAADGWKVGTYYESTFIWKGCRAWNYSDDGFDPHGSGTRIFDNCWASSKGIYVDLTPMWGTEGNGFKTTGPNGIVLPSDENNVIYKNCIAASNPGSGFITNLVTPNEYPSNPLEIHNFAYDNGHAYWDLAGGEIRNNIAYGTRNIGPIGEVYHIVGNEPYTESNNTWYLIPEPSGSWPFNLERTDLEINDDDFVSIDVYQLELPRKSDNSLPDITFGHLAEGSDLIDAGIFVSGFHCPTPGATGDCITWYGSAPDIGAFESNY